MTDKPALYENVRKGLGRLIAQQWIAKKIGRRTPIGRKWPARAQAIVSPA
jgi:hypothetical protein